jgi:hypothetical protein
MADEQQNPEPPKHEESAPLSSQDSGTGGGSTNAGGYTMGCGALIAFFPMIIAWFETAPGSNMWSEGDPNSGGAVLWLMMLTVPIGFFVGLIGLIMQISSSSKSKKK